MATRKVKRYNGEDDAVTSSAADTSEAGMQEAEPAENFKPTSFKDAFASARSAGGKTFMWQGKKYTTELAGEKKAAPERVASAVKDAKAGTKSQEAANKSIMRRAPVTAETYDPSAINFGDMKVAPKAAPEERKKTSFGMSQRSRPYAASFKKPEKREPLPTASDQAYKKGGMTASKRADGIAQRGKTKGTMVMCGGGYMKGKK